MVLDGLKTTDLSANCAGLLHVCQLQKCLMKYYNNGGGVALWLRHYAANRQVVSSIPDGVIGIFQVT
jgi:hypothetical protein